MKNHKPLLTDSNSWAEIENTYLDLINHGWEIQPMLNLIKHIRNSNLKEKLYAFTSLHKLIVGIYDQIDRNSEAIHIEFNQKTRKWFFHYKSKPYQQNNFERTYNEELGIEKFEQFLKYLKW